jgi:1,4-dihydroxy-6-naphthoate synthase
MKLSIGFSPCPNDTFIFDALVHKKIDLEGLDFEVVMADVEELNRKAFDYELDITKLSFHAAGWLCNEYVILDSGSALGNNCGPLLIAAKKLGEPEIEKSTIAIPGKFTTANLLFSIAYPKAVNKVNVLFSEIEDTILSGKADAGLIIHENRFTYESKGLVKLIDLGEFWEERYHAPIPLGAIAVKRNLPAEIQQAVNRIVRRSVEFALKNPASSIGFVKCHAQAMEESVMHQHINLYVNDFTVNLDIKGKSAVNRLFQTARLHKIIPYYEGKIFLN